MKEEHNKQTESAHPGATDNGAAQPAASLNDAARPAASVNGLTINWRLLDQLLEESRQASIEMGCYNPSDIKPLTDEELAAIAESSRRLDAMPLPKAHRKSEDLIREMRDASVGIYPEPEPKS